MRTRYIREAQSFFEALSQIDGIKVYPSRANFALVELVNGATAFDFVSHLLIRHGIYTRGCGDKKGLDGEFVRIAARTAIENQHILHGIREITGVIGEAVSLGARSASGDEQTRGQRNGESAPPRPLSRAEVLGGLTGRTIKHASTVLALIENQTAQLAAQTQQTMDQRLTGATSRSTGHAFFAALLLGRERSDPVMIDDVERYAPEWAPLGAGQPPCTAAVAHLLGRKYRFTHPEIPRLRAALGLDTPPVQEAFQRRYSAPIVTIFAVEAAPTALQPGRVAALEQPGAAETLGLRVVPVNKLIPHEYHNPQRVTRLARRLSTAGVLANPPLVVALPDNEQYMVLDGATRTMAFQQLGYPHIVVQVVDPHKDAVQLNTWYHVVRGSAHGLLEHVRGINGVRLTSLPTDKLPHALWERGALSYLITADREGFLVEHTESSAGADWLTSSQLVERYGVWGTVERTLVDDVAAQARNLPIWRG